MMDISMVKKSSSTRVGVRDTNATVYTKLTLPTVSTSSSHRSRGSITANNSSRGRSVKRSDIIHQLTKDAMDEVQTARMLNNNPHQTSVKGQQSRRGRSKPREKPRIEYDSPFDAKGRCHYHKNVQLASKKMTGGWKVLMVACPKCMEDKCDDDHDDDKSVKSTRSTRSVRSTSSGGAGGDAQGQFDKNGCCVLHPHIQVAKKPLFGNGWKVRIRLM